MSNNIKLQSKLKENSLCKHFKGKNLIEKNIYQILKLGISGKEIKDTEIIYTGVRSNYLDAVNLVIYTNPFDGKIFAREYDDLVSELSKDDKNKYQQEYRVQILNEEEISLVNTPNFIEEKKSYIKHKNGK